MKSNEALLQLLSNRPTLIAEVHPQHQGRMDLLKEMIFAAKDVGVDFCKIQVYESVRTLGSDRWQYLEYSDADLDDLFAFTEAIEMPVFASVFSYEDLQRIRRYEIPLYKIASRTVQDEPFCRQILDTGAPVICSLGAWKEKELPFSKDAYPNLFYLNCVSEYPTPLEKTRYAFSKYCRARVDGISDHAIGPGIALAAIAHGARIIERHMSMTRYHFVETERAHLCSSDPDEFRLIRSLGDRIAAARLLSGVADDS